MLLQLTERKELKRLPKPPKESFTLKYDGEITTIQPYPFSELL
jgi:hypothetical protein